MGFHIVNADAVTIASFVNEFDRETCLYALLDEFPDCVFTRKDD